MYDYAIKLLKKALDGANKEMKDHFVNGGTEEERIKSGFGSLQDICDLEDAIETLESINKDYSTEG